MAKKIEGLEIVSRDAENGSAEYIYKGTHIFKRTLNKGVRSPRIRNTYVRKGAYYTFWVTENGKTYPISEMQLNKILQKIDSIKVGA